MKKHCRLFSFIDSPTQITSTKKMTKFELILNIVSENRFNHYGGVMTWYRWITKKNKDSSKQNFVEFLVWNQTFIRSTWKGVGGGLKICHMFADSIVFKQ